MPCECTHAEAAEAEGGSCQAHAIGEHNAAGPIQDGAMFSPDSEVDAEGGRQALPLAVVAPSGEHDAAGPIQDGAMFSPDSEVDAEGGRQALPLAVAAPSGEHDAAGPIQDGAMFSPDSDVDAEGGHQTLPLAVVAPLPGLTLVERKQAGAAYARAVRAAKAGRPAPADKAVAPSWSWSTPAEEKAARALLYEPILASRKAAGRMLHIDYRKMQRWATTAACLMMDAERAAFAHLLAEIARLHSEGVLQPTLFIWGRMYDETPVRHWTHVLKDGQMQGQTSIAKVMAALLTFSMVVEVSPTRALDTGSVPCGMIGAPDGDPPPPCCFAGAPEAAHPQGRQDRSRFVIIRGSLGARLASMGQQTAGIVRESIRQIMSLQPDEKSTADAVFTRKCILRETDLHKSGLAAERALAKDDPSWASIMFRCGMHRARTAELLTSSLDSKTESFFLNCTLVLRQQPDAMRSFRERVDAWVTKALKVYHGAPPPAVREWRQTMRPLLFSGNTTHVSEAARQHCWDHVLNGDGRVRDEVQHFCEGPACCPKGRQDTLTKVLGPYGVGALLSPMPKTFPRRSWHGQCEVVSHVLLIECTHGMLSQSFKTVEAAA